MRRPASTITAGNLALGLTVASLACAPSPLAAQQPDLAIDVVGGAALATGNTARASGSGAAVGFGIMHRISDRVALTTDLQLSRFYDGAPESEAFGASTDIRIWRATAGPTLRLTSATSPWILRARAALGIAGIRSGPLPPGPSQEPHEARDAGLNEDVFTVTGGVELSRDIGSMYVPFLRAQADLYDMKHFLLGLSLLDPDIPQSGTLTGYSLLLGVRIEF